MLLMGGKKTVYVGYCLSAKPVPKTANRCLNKGQFVLHFKILYFKRHEICFGLRSDNKVEFFPPPSGLRCPIIKV